MSRRLRNYLAVGAGRARGVRRGWLCTTAIGSAPTVSARDAPRALRAPGSSAALVDVRAAERRVVVDENAQARVPDAVWIDDGGEWGA